MKRLKRWILIADGARARIVERLGTGKNTRILESYRFDSDVPLCRALSCDGPVRRRNRLGSSHRDAAPVCERPCNLETKFACQLADLLKERSAKGDFDRLLIVAPPSMLGNLRAALGAGVEVKVIAEVAADLTKAANIDIVRRLETENLLC